MKVIDLTHPIAENMPMYPGTDGPKLQPAFTHKEHGYMETLISLYSHTGTHIDAPLHSLANARSLDSYPVEHFVGKALVVDCSRLASNSEIPMLLLHEKGALLDEVEFVLFNTGQSALWGTAEYFSEFPVPSREVIEWVNLRKLKGLGVDAPSIDPIAATNFWRHRLVLETGNTLLIENLCCLSNVGDGVFTFCALPLKTVNADGAPTRAVALVG